MKAPESIPTSISESTLLPTSNSPAGPTTTAPSPGVPAPDEDSFIIRIFIRPLDVDDWVMGPDYPIQVSEVQPFHHVMSTLYKLKNIHPSRQVLSDTIKNKDIPPTSYHKTLRALGIRRDQVLTLRPTFAHAWRWETQEYYEEALIKETKERIKSLGKPGSMVSLKLVEQAVVMPPPLKEKGSLRSFIRKWPEHFVVETRIQSGEVYVGLPSMSPDALDVPRWV